MNGKQLIELIKKYGLEDYTFGVLFETEQDNYETEFNGSALKIDFENGSAYISAKYED